MVIRKETFTNLHGCDDVVYAGKDVKSAGSGPTPRTLKQSTAGFRHRSPITVGGKRTKRQAWWTKSEDAQTPSAPTRIPCHPPNAHSAHY